MSDIQKHSVRALLNNGTIHVVLIFIGTFLYTLMSSQWFFFWDTITEVSIPANFYYDTGFGQSYFSEPGTTGHQTVIPFYIALMWKLFGRTLVVAHFTLFPYIFGLFYLIYRYIKSSGNSGSVLLPVFFLVVIDPTLLSQASLVTFDIPHLFFYLLCIVCYTERKYLLFAISLTGLCLVSLRGCISAAGIVIYSLTEAYIRTNKVDKKLILLFVPGILSVVGFLVLFLTSKNWSIQEYFNSLYGEETESFSIIRTIKNIGIFGWRLVDYGRVVVVFIFFYACYKSWRDRLFHDIFLRNTFLIVLSQMILFFPVMIFFNKFLGHRYLLPVIIPMTVCTGYWIFRYSKLPKTLFLIAGSLLISGSFWIYPDKIAQGWDATPSHWPYYKMRNEMVGFLKKESIPVEEVGSFFPNFESFKNTDLSANNSSFKVADPVNDRYILYSNVFNIPDKKLDILKNSEAWEIKRNIKRCGLYMILLESK